MNICVQVEGRSTGKIDKETYKTYLRAWGPLYILPILMLLLAAAERSVYGLQNWWLSVWSNANVATPVYSFVFAHYTTPYCLHASKQRGLHAHRVLAHLFLLAKTAAFLLVVTTLLVSVQIKQMGMLGV